MGTRHTARYVGYSRGTENLGDEALYEIIGEILAPEIVVDRDAETSDLALLGGGTLINQSPWLIHEFQKHLDRTGRGVVFGTGVGDPAFWGDRFSEWRSLLDRCDLVGVRGPLSVRSLREHGMERAEEIGDPYLCVECPSPPANQEKRLGVNLGSTNNSLWGTNDSDFLEYMADVLRRLKAAGWTFEWFSVWSKDLPLVERLRETVDPASPPVRDARADTPGTFAALAACEAVVGEKLHALAMAAVAGVPFVSMEYQPKVRDFAESLRMRAWVVKTSERDPERLAAMIENLQREREKVAKTMTERRDDLRGRVRAFAARIKSLFV
jgi:polysaccharide pyruvyl transferase WcaK-like protein